MVKERNNVIQDNYRALRGQFSSRTIMRAAKLLSTPWQEDEGILSKDIPAMSPMLEACTEAMIVASGYPRESLHVVSWKEDVEKEGSKKHGVTVILTSETQPVDVMYRAIALYIDRHVNSVLRPNGGIA